jgi:hypothetical protein
MDLRSLSAAKQAAHQELHEALPRYGPIQLIYGRDTFDLFQQTAEFRHSVKFSWPGNVQIYEQPYHGCIVVRETVI